MLVKLGALEAEPKLSVPLLMLKTQGAVIGVEEALSSRVQFAPAVFIRTVFVPFGSVLASRPVTAVACAKFVCTRPVAALIIWGSLSV